MIEFEVAAGVHRIEHGFTNCYLVEDDDGVLLVDAGFPRTWPRVQSALDTLGRGVEEIRGLLITHGHFDHVGFARLVQSRFGVPVWGHRADAPILAHPYSYVPQRPRGLYPLAHPGGLPVLTAMVAAGALRVPGVTADHELTPGVLNDLPGRPEIIHTPGHTDGEVVVLLADRSALITGDALVMLDPYTGRRGPHVVARAATHDARQALASLDPLARYDVRHVLTGHGRVWHGGIRSAVDTAYANGVA